MVFTLALLFLVVIPALILWAGKIGHVLGTRKRRQPRVVRRG